MARRPRVPLKERLALLEAEYGKPARQIIIEAIDREGSILGAARKLSIPQDTLYRAVDRLHIQYETATKVLT